MSLRRTALLLAGASMIALAPVALADEAASSFDGGTWQFRARLISVIPDEDADISVIGGTVDIDTSYVPEFDITYYFTKNWAAELILAVTPHTITHEPTGIELGDVWLLPPTLTLQYHFAPDSTSFRPYLGAGVNYTIFFGDDAASGISFGDFDSSFGFALQAGFDIPINDNGWVFNVDVKKIWLNTEVDVTLPGPLTVNADVDINPWVIGVGFGYKY